jgi:hypothetical protein
MSSDQDVTSAERDATIAWVLFVSTFVAVVLNGLWTLVVGTASMGGDESELVRGWSGVLRNLPGYVLSVLVASLGLWFSHRAIRKGSRRGRSALVATSLGLLFALASVTRDSAEVVMTTRAATVSWLLFGISAVLVAATYVIVRRSATHPS